MFNVGKWKAEIIEILNSYNAFQNLIQDEDTLSFYVNKMSIVSWRDDSFPVNASLDVDTQLRSSEISAIKDANQIYRRQMIVLIETHLEAIISDFLECVFFVYPTRMYEYLNTENNVILKGKIDLKEILEADSKDALIYRLISRATNIATKGKFKTALNNLERITKQQISANLSKNLNSMVEQRNRIVHEAGNDAFTNEQVHENINYLFCFLGELREIAEKIKVEVNDPTE